MFGVCVECSARTHTPEGIRAAKIFPCQRHGAVSPIQQGKDTVTFVLVSVQQVLKLCVEDLQVLLDQDLLTLSGQFVLGGFMEVNLHTPLLLQETGLRLRKRTQRKQTDSGHDSALKAPRVSARSPTAVCSWTAQRLPSSCTL